LFHLVIREDVELRLLEEHHCEQVFRVTEQNRRRLRRWLPWVDSVATPEDTRAFIRGSLQQFAEHNGFQAGVWVRKQFAGVIGHHKIDWLNRRVELGYWLAAGFEGRGIMTDACRAVVRHAFGEYLLHRVEIRCASGNRRSRAIPERLGFTEEGTLRHAEWLYDHYVDLVVYAMLAEEWSG